MIDRPSGYYWVRFIGDQGRWHIAYHNQHGWSLSYDFSCPNEGHRSNDEAEREFIKIVGPIATP